MMTHTLATHFLHNNSCTSTQHFPHQRAGCLALRLDAAATRTPRLMRFRLSRCSCCTSCFSARTSFSRLASESATERPGRIDFFWLLVGASDPDSMAAGVLRRCCSALQHRPWKTRTCFSYPIHYWYILAPRTLTLPLPYTHHSGREVIAHSLHASRLVATFAELTVPCLPACTGRRHNSCASGGRLPAALLAQKMELYLFSRIIRKVGAAPLPCDTRNAKPRRRVRCPWPPPLQLFNYAYLTGLAGRAHLLNATGHSITQGARCSCRSRLLRCACAGCAVSGCRRPTGSRRRSCCCHCSVS